MIHVDHRTTTNDVYDEIRQKIGRNDIQIYGNDYFISGITPSPIKLLFPEFPMRVYYGSKYETWDTDALTQLAQDRRVYRKALQHSTKSKDLLRNELIDQLFLYDLNHGIQE